MEGLDDMYCPKCGASNRDDLAFCRECGENLQVISQVLKKHLPFSLLSKIDSAIERKDERLRRDSILNTAVGAALLISTIFAPFGANFFDFLNIAVFLFGVFSVSYGGWQFLTYRRSLELASASRNLAVEDQTASIELFHDENVAVTMLESVQVAFCPNCGTANQRNLAFCPSCGAKFDFRFEPKGLEKYLPRFVLRKLDAAVIKNEQSPFKPQYKSGRTLLIVAFVYLVNIVLQGWSGNWGAMAIYLISGLALIISGAWNLIAYRRDLEKTGSLAELPGVPKKSIEIFSTTSKIGAAIILFSIGAMYFGITGAWILALFGALMIVATSLRILQRRHKRDRIAQVEYRTTEGLEFSEDAKTLHLNLPPESVTEDTTKVLDSPLAQPAREKLSTARDLANPRR